MGVREANIKELKYLKRLGFVTSVMGGLSIVSLFDAGFSLGWTQPFRLVIEQYLVIVNTIRDFIEPYIVPLFEFLTELLDIGVSYGPRWPDVFLLMAIYLGSRVKSYFASEKYIRAVLLFFLISSISVVAAFFASSLNLTSSIVVFAATAIPLLGFLVYDLVYACVGATLDRRGKPWWPEFKRHVSFSVPLLVLSLCINFAVLEILLSKTGTTLYQSFVIVFAIDYFIISAFWAIQSLRHASKRENRLLGETQSERFWRSSATNVSLNVGLTIISAMFFMLGNAGLSSAGIEASQLIP